MREARIDSLIERDELRRLFDYWRGLRRGRTMPAKADIDPLDIGWALSRIFLLDYVPGTGFVYRLAGGEVSRVFGRGNLKGLNLRDILVEDRARTVERLWMQIIEERCILSMKGMVYLGADRTPIGERLLLPLADEGGNRVTAVLGMTVCEWVAGEVPQEVKLARSDTLPVSEIP